MRLFLKVVSVTLMMAGCVCSQDFLKVGLSVGIKGGLPLTDSLTDTVIPQISTVGLNGFISPAIHAYSDSKNFVVGPMIELHLPLGFSFEADGLYRPQSVTEVFSFSSQYFTVTPLQSSRSSSSWEVSTLGKFTLPYPLVKPYVAAGPSFRILDNSLSSYFSSKGVTAAAGLNLTVHHFRVGPELRFTHWGNDPVRTALATLVTNPFSGSGIVVGLPGLVSLPAAPFPIRSRRNQLELLFSLSF